MPSSCDRKIKMIAIQTNGGVQHPDPEATAEVKNPDVLTGSFVTKNI